MGKKTQTIKVHHLARVEGEGGLEITLQGNEVTQARLNIFEPPRYFEALLRGRAFTDAPDITARICGICPVAYQMSACHAMEHACNVQVGEPLRTIRRLLYCGEWIQSHVLHIYMLHAPDFLGFDSAISMAKVFPKEVERGLKMKKIGNDLIRVLGGREIHPINVRVGGFYRLPAIDDLKALQEDLRWGRNSAIETIRWLATLDFPTLERDYELVSLQHPNEYPMNEGRIVSNKGINISVEEYAETFEEYQVPHSTALHSQTHAGGAYLVGPMARFNLNFDKLSPICHQLAHEVGLTVPCLNPFKSILMRAIEVLYAYDHALSIIESLDYQPDQMVTPVVPREGAGCAATEAPRGLLYHHYKIDDNGLIKNAVIIPPTSQNQPSIEADLTEFVRQHIGLPKEELTLRCEQTIRNYDPCISCSTHFLDLRFKQMSDKP